jgi:fructose-bisphosphate aldolase class II
MRRHLALNTAVCKFNVGTELRQTFGRALRQTLADDPDMFDRGQILRATKPALTAMAVEVMRNLI